MRLSQTILVCLSCILALTASQQCTQTENGMYYPAVTVACPGNRTAFRFEYRLPPSDRAYSGMRVSIAVQADAPVYLRTAQESNKVLATHGLKLPWENCERVRANVEESNAFAPNPQCPWPDYPCQSTTFFGAPLTTVRNLAIVSYERCTQLTVRVHLQDAAPDGNGGICTLPVQVHCTSTNKLPNPPTLSPIAGPTEMPSLQPTAMASNAPSLNGTAVPPAAVAMEVNAVPTLQPSNQDTNNPIQAKAPVLVPVVNTRSNSGSDTHWHWILGVLA